MALEIPTFEQEPGKYYLTVPMYYSMALNLGEQALDWEIAAGKKIDTVVGAPRGSLELMNMIAQFLKLPGESVQGITLNTRNEEEQLEKVTTGQMPEEIKIYGKVVLWADDVRDTGRTEDAAEKTLLDLGAAEVIRADLGYKPENDEATPKRPPNLRIFETNIWTVFPWERVGEYRKAMESLREQGATKAQLMQLKANFMFAQRFSNVPVLSQGIVKL